MESPQSRSGRRGRSIPGILLGLAIISALVWHLGFRDQGRIGRALGDPLGGDRGVVMDTALLRLLPLPAVEYLAACGRKPRLPEDPGLQNEFITGCINRLAAALDAVAGSDTTRQQLIAMHLRAVHHHSRVLANVPPAPIDQRRLIREALLAQAYLFVQLERSRYKHVPRLAREVAQTRRSARAMADDVPLPEQREQLEGFLARAGNALYLMAAEESR